MTREDGVARGWFRPRAYAASVLVVLAASGCAAYRPCPSPPVPLAGRPEPPSACRSDGCSVAPDFDFAGCCIRHDEHYWLGGTKEARLEADRELRGCIAGHGHTALAHLYYLGVRLGGSPLLPTPWRWGFGWPYYRSYDPE